MNGEDENLHFLNRVKAGLEDGGGPSPAVLEAIRLTAIRENPARRRRWALPLAAAASLALAGALPFLTRGGGGADALPLTVQAIAFIGESDDDLDIAGLPTGDSAGDRLLAWQDAPYYEAVANIGDFVDNSALEF